MDGSATGADGETALRRSLWMIGAFTLLTQNLFSWYLLWLLPLVAVFVQPGVLRPASRCVDGLVAVLRVDWLIVHDLHYRLSDAVGHLGAVFAFVCFDAGRSVANCAR